MQKLLLLIALIVCIVDADQQPKCPCDDQNDCNRIMTNWKTNQTIGYVLESDSNIWSTFKWNKLTMIALIDFHQPKLMCLAHHNKIRIMAFGNFTLNDLSSSDKMHEWIENRIKEAQNNFYDGINLFIDDPVEPNSTFSQRITDFVSLTTKHFHEKLPGSIVLFNAPFSPKNEKGKAVDGKNYDYVAISKSVDLMIAMDFDQRSQSFDEPKCLAGAPESLYITIGSLMAYKNIGVDLNRMILTLGFYVDEYLCIEYHQNYRCIIQPYNYRGANCSSKIANRIPWNVYKTMIGQCWIQVWDEHSNHDIYTYLDNSIYGQIKQYWSDYPAIFKKMILIDENQMSGIGVWMLNYLDDKIWSQLPERQ
ncbi:di-N-acetylchitobiase [Dermatophagoides farinae]|uniref:di-N-acetylchitobiase n=1 Tax=Dermatophagoides farinae TaxID=6954 RepID=UPI003F616778